MNVAFDTLAFAKKLIECGVEEKQAEGMAEVHIEVLSNAMENNFATKEDIIDLRSEIKEDMADLRSEIKEDMADLRSEIKEDMADLRSATKEDIADLRSEIKDVKSELKQDITALRGEIRELIFTTKNDTLRWVIGFFIAQIGLVFAGAKMFLK